MKVLFIANRAQEWPYEIPSSSAATARAYLTDPRFSTGIDAQW